MKEILFVTGNAGKFKLVNNSIKELDSSIILTQIDIDVPEIQSLDTQEVAILKAKEAFKILKKPLLIDDGGIFLEQYNNFPGALSKYIFQGIGLEGIWKLAKDNPKANFTAFLVYIDNIDSYKVFTGTITGRLVEPRGPVQDLSLPYREIFIPDGSDKLLSEIKDTEEGKKYRHRFKATQEFINWFNNKDC